MERKEMFDKIIEETDLTADDVEAMLDNDLMEILSELRRDKVLTMMDGFLKGKIEEAKAKGIVLGLSGGLDSALCADICMRVLGPEKVHMYYMPDDTTPKGDGDVVMALFIHWKDMYGVKPNLAFIYMDEVEKMFFSAIRSLKEFRHINDSKYAVPNTKARLRATYLYFFANLMNCLVAGTCNKSEILTGYFTKFGDGASDFELIGSFYKTEVFEIARDMGLPDYVVDKAPSAGLIDGQTDEGELGMTYAVLDKILGEISVLMDAGDWDIKIEWTDLMDIISEKYGIELSEVKRIFALVKANEHKRHMPPIPTILKGLDLITNGADYKDLVTIEFRDRVKNAKEPDDDWFEYVLEKLSERPRIYIGAKLGHLTDSLMTTGDYFFEEVLEFGDYSIWD